MNLSEAIKLGRLDEFIEQEEKRGHAVSQAALEGALSTVIRSPRSEDQTSPEPSSDGSSEKQTR